MPDDSYPVNVYGPRIPWEMPVQLGLSDILRPGDCALDVGANIGGLSIAMSRLVGPSGKVHAFEANPYTVQRLKADRAANAANNVVVVSAAAWSRSNETVSFYCDDSYYAVGSSVERRSESWQEVKAPTQSLDDHCRDHGLTPRAIKLDVEGVEIEVLRGAARVLAECQPSLIIEYYPASDAKDDALEFLASRGYACYDTNLYRKVDREFYLKAFSPPVLVNVLAVSPTSPARAIYSASAVIAEDEQLFRAGTATSAPLAFRRAGRYLVSVGVDGPNDAVAALTIVDASGNQLAYVQTQIGSLRAHTNSNLIFEVDGALTGTCAISSLDGAAVHLRRVCVNRIDFRGQPASARMLSLARRAGAIFAGLAGSASTQRRAG